MFICFSEFLQRNFSIKMTLEYIGFAVAVRFSLQPSGCLGLLGSGEPTGACFQVPESVAGREPFAQLAKLMEARVGEKEPGSQAKGSFLVEGKWDLVLLLMDKILHHLGWLKPYK